MQCATLVPPRPTTGRRPRPGSIRPVAASAAPASPAAAADAADTARAGEYGVGCRPKLVELLECLGLDVTYTRARGAFLYREGPDGHEVPVLDLVGGFGAGLLGHNNPELRELVKAQLDAEVPFLAQSALRREAGRLAQRLNEALGTRRRYLCHLTNSGAEAIEAALKHAYKVRFDAVRREFERVARSIEAFFHATARDWPDIEIPGAGRDLGGLRDDLDEHNLAELERFQRHPVVLAFKGSFHGKTATALKITFNKSYREGFEGLSAVQPEFLDFADVARLPEIVGGHRIELLVPRVEAGRIVVDRLPMSTVIALCLEVIQGEGGIRPVPEAVLASLAQQHDALALPYLVDEIQTGCGRTGTFVAFRATPLGAIDPEYIALSKTLGGGLAKVGAALIREDVYDADFGILHTSTFAEDELGCLVARRVVEILTRDGGRLMREVMEKGEYLLAGLRRLQERFPRVIREVRGRGLMLGLELAALEDASPLFRLGARQGFLSLLVASWLLHRRNVRILAPLTTLLKGNPGKKRMSVLRIQPAAQITRAQMDEALEALADVCTIIDRNHEGALVAHLLGVSLDEDELRNPPRQPVAYPTRAVRADFDARVGFVVHPAHLEQVIAYYFPSLAGRVDEARLARWWSRLARFLEPDLFHTGYIASGGFVVEVNVVGVPFLPEDLMDAYQAAHAPDAPRAAVLRLQEIQDRVQDAVTLARELGDDHIPTSMVGLGAYTSIVTERGTTINDYEVPITTGNAYTAGLMLQGIQEAAELQGIALPDATAAVVGAAGNIGSVLAALLAPRVRRLRLVGSAAPGSLERLRATRRACVAHLAGKARAQLEAGVPLADVRLGGVGDRLLADVVLPAVRAGAWRPGEGGAEELVRLVERALDAQGAPALNRYIALDLSVDAVRDCDVVTVATNSAAGRLITPELVRPGAVVSCASVPSNLSTAFRDHLGEYMVFDGGYARLPEDQVIDCIGLPAGGLAFGCLSETLLLGFDGRNRSFARGPLTTEQVEETLALAECYGFSLGDFRLNDAAHPRPARVRAAA